MTREEIVKKHFGLKYPKDRDLIFGAMDDLAKQEAIEFDTWKMENDWKWELDAVVGLVWYNDNDKGKSPLVTTEQLYNLYLQCKKP